MKKNLLITGATGMLGATLVKVFQKNFEVYATSTHSNGLDYFKHFKTFDLFKESYKELMDWANPEVIIHCAALTNGNYCENNPEQAFLINGIAVKKILSSTNQNVKIIYISTDAVFPSNLHLAAEDDCTLPESVYGKSKEIGEFFLRNSNRDYKIIRTTIVGFNENKQRQGFLEWIISSVKNKEEIMLFDDVIFTPITIWDLAKVLRKIIENFSSISNKILHVVGTEFCTKYEFGILLLEAINLPKDSIKRGKISLFIERAKRSNDQTLSCKHSQKILNLNLPSIKDTIENIKANYKNEHH